MNISDLYSNGSVTFEHECIHGIAFKNAAAGARCALLPVLCDSFGLLWDYCAHLSRIECLLPHSSPA